MAKWHRLVGPVLLVAFLGGVVLHGKTLEAVEVTLLEGAEEPADGGVAGIGGSPPDYRLDVRAGNRWLESAVFKDTTIGAGLRFEVPGPPPYGAATALRLIEEDKVVGDTLEELPIEGEAFDGKAYRFELERRLVPRRRLRVVPEHPSGGDPRTGCFGSARDPRGDVCAAQTRSIELRWRPEFKFEPPPTSPETRQAQT